MTLHCPRCQTWMEAFTRHGSADSMPIEADMCLSCGGLWLDGGEVAVAYPGLSVLGDRRADVLAIGTPGAGISSCPRCQMPAIEVPFFDVKLDLCPDCFGVWIDGDEMEALSSAMDRGDGLPVPTEVVGGYRTAAAGVMTKHLATCAACQKQVPLRGTVSTTKGVLCDACAKEDLSADTIPANEVPEDVVPADSGVWRFVCDVGSALGAILALTPRCPTCGRRRTSGCTC